MILLLLIPRVINNPILSVMISLISRTVELSSYTSTFGLVA